MCIHIQNFIKYQFIRKIPPVMVVVISFVRPFTDNLTRFSKKLQNVHVINQTSQIKITLKTSKSYFPTFYE